MQYGFYRYAVQIHYGLNTKNSRKLKPGKWLFGASWWNNIKAFRFFEIAQVSLFLLAGGAEIVTAQAGPWQRLMLDKLH